jgi:hypothetical protein
VFCEVTTVLVSFAEKPNQSSFTKEKEIEGED